MKVRNAGRTAYRQLRLPHEIYERLAKMAMQQGFVEAIPKTTRGDAIKQGIEALITDIAMDTRIEEE